MNAEPVAAKITGGIVAVQCEPSLLDTRDARKILGGIAENTFKPLMLQLGVSPVKIGTRVFWHLSDVRRVADVLRARSLSAQEPA